MTTTDITLHAKDSLELVAQLRAMADQIEQNGSVELPSAGASKRIYHEGELAGEMSAPAVVSVNEAAESAIIECELSADFMEMAASAQATINHFIRISEPEFLGGLLDASDLIAIEMTKRAHALGSLVAGGE